MKMSKEIRLFDYVKILWKQKISIVAIVFMATFGTIVYSYFMSPQYRAEAVIMPISSMSTASGGSSASLASSFSLLGGMGDGTTNSFIIYLNSKALKIQVVKALNLLSMFFPENKNEKILLSEEQKLNLAGERLGGMATIENDRLYRQKINISAVSEDPEFATKLVRQYLVELQNFIANNALTQAKRQLAFLEKQLAKNKEETLEMGKTMSRFYGLNPVSLKKATLNVPIAVYTKEGVRDFKNYEEFTTYFNTLQKGDPPLENSEVQSVPDVPHQIYLKYVTIQQQILENNYVMLSQSYETAKMEVARQEPSFQILDEPVVPLHRFSPNRREMAKMAFGISFLLGILWAFYREFYGSQFRWRPMAADYGKEELAEKVA